MNNRRDFLLTTSAAAAASALAPLSALAQERRFAPQPAGWRTFEVSKRVEPALAQGASQVWIPIPSVDTGWQRSLESRISTNGRAERAADGVDGARMLRVSFDASVPQPFVELTTRVQTRDRAVDWSARAPAREDAATLAHALRPTALIPTDGIVRDTARKVVGDARSDADKVRRIYDWVVGNSWREPSVRGCGEGDIKTMLENGDLGGKCADINALFVGLCRSTGVPARDVYGLRLAPSAFGYKELGSNPANLKASQHCRAEVFLQAHGWVAMDPADVAKVMRQETPEWIKTVRHPVVAPVYQGLYGGWEGNWVAYNTAHDVVLPGSRHGRLGFLMYPVAEDAQGRFDSYAPDDFRYQISARELEA
ncbi:transglutaminase-like domain-containing protein [Ramlibacter sp. Leaf400]|uniref:transglutaminase-like domain-containing protein n=1 Tax=Ramlibacter sp. Leaf400 TaxID=1736365 RepID=UPI0006F493C7|nr:transglutaminase domain-containing protein [Ramlibacter sp. Leaf400]KQT10377.1 transglutaminase [Ramlibacter sp. Leaf400]